MSPMRLVILLGLLPSLAACRSIHYHDSTGSSLLLAETELSDGTKTSWRMHPGPGRGNAPRIDRTESSQEERARVGLGVSAVTRNRAESVGVEPWRGVWIDEVDPRGPAGKAGLVSGDILLSVGGVHITSSDQFSDLVQTRAVAGEPLEFVLRVFRRPGEPLSEEQTASVTVIPETVMDRKSATESIVLDYSPALQSYTGLQVGNVPTDVAGAVWHSEGPVVLVTGVVTGSPAYHAGFRPGDRVKQVDGKAVLSLADLRAALYRRVAHERWPLEDLAQLAGGSTNGELEPTGDPLELAVEGPLGAHSTALRPIDDMRKETDFDIPILFEYSATADAKRVSFLDFIFQFGFNYWRTTVPSDTREPLDLWELSLFPLGMFEFEKQEDHNEYTFFWLIDFETSHRH